MGWICMIYLSKGGAGADSKPQRGSAPGNAVNHPGYQNLFLKLLSNWYCYVCYSQESLQVVMIAVCTVKSVFRD